MGKAEPGIGGERPAAPMPVNTDCQSGRPQVPLLALLQCTNLGGMEKVAYELFEQLAACRFSLRFATPRPWGPGRERVLRVAPAARAFDYRGKFGWRSFLPFRREVQALATGCERVWVVGTCVSCLAAALSTGKPTLLSHHYHHFEDALSRLRWTAFYLAFGPWLDAITYPTEFTRNEALRIAPWLKSKSHVVRNGFDVHYTTEERRLADRAATRAALGVPSDAFLVGNACWFVQRKRLDVFLRTAQIVCREAPTAHFFICGGGPEEGSLRALAHELGIAGRVRFEGWVHDMPAFYRAWDAVLFNSDFDTLPRAPMEAAGYGCVCVASNTYGGISEFLRDGENGFLFPQHNPEVLARALISLWRNPALGLRLRQGAVRALEREFSARAALRFHEAYFGSSV